MEQQPQSNEHLTTPEAAGELEKLAEAQLESQREQSEHSGEQQQEQVEAARSKIEHQSEQDQPDFTETAPKPKPIVTRLDKAMAYRQTIQSLQRKLNPTSRAFSKVIHTPAIERTSEVIGKTVMRPSVTLGGSLTALIVGSLVYFTAKNYGFPLTGSELILALVIGGLIGAVIEFVFKLLRRH